MTRRKRDPASLNYLCVNCLAPVAITTGNISILPSLPLAPSHFPLLSPPLLLTLCLTPLFDAMQKQCAMRLVVKGRRCAAGGGKMNCSVCFVVTNPPSKGKTKRKSLNTFLKSERGGKVSEGDQSRFLLYAPQAGAQKEKNMLREAGLQRVICLLAYGKKLGSPGSHDELDSKAPITNCSCEQIIVVPP